MLPTLQVGPLSLQVPGLIILIGLWIGLNLSERRARQHGENPAAIYNLVFIVLIAGLVGARLAYALTYSEAFLTNPWSLVSINTGLLDPFAGALIAITAGAIYLMRKQMDIWKMLDAITPLMAVMGIAVGISHLASGTAFGRPTDLPIGIHLWGELRHPTQVYEIIMAALILGAVFLVDRTWWNRVPGMTFLLFIGLTAFSRLLLEAFRGDSLLVGDGFRAAQLVAWIVLAVCLALIAGRFKSSATTKENGV